MSRITIVLVDDYEAVTLALNRLLANENDFEVVGMAKTATRGLEIIGEKKPDVAIVDYHLPDGDGLQLTKDILNVSPDTSVIVLSGSIKVNAVAVAEAGGKKFLDKTLAASNLPTVIRSVVSQSLKE